MAGSLPPLSVQETNTGYICELPGEIWFHLCLVVAAVKFPDNYSKPIDASAGMNEGENTVCRGCA
ncbi:hypothetical protein BDZ89DRAFT_1072429, partial [Hymenopellis radicata]